MRVHDLSRGVVRAALVVGLALATGCFDGEELTKGLVCAEDSNCGGNLQCLPSTDPLVSGLVCSSPVGGDDCETGTGGCNIDTMNPGSATTTAGTSSTSSTTSPTTTAGSSATEGPPCVSQGSSCTNGETCCDGTTCVFYAEGDSRCETTCALGGECGSCCCVPLENMSANVCVEASFCSQEQYCGGACASPGAICNTDDDCCDPSPYGASCLLNSGNWYSCFKICSVPSDCVSGCCNYNANSGQYICEATCA